MNFRGPYLRTGSPIRPTPILRILDILTPADRRNLVWLLVAIAVLAAFEVVGIAAILPFMSLLAEPEQIDRPGWAATLYAAGDFGSRRSFVIAVGAAVLFFLTVSRLFNLLVFYLQARFIAGMSHRTDTRLLRYYLDKPYRYYLDHHTADIQAHLLADLDKLFLDYLRPLLRLVTNAVTATVVVALLFYFDARVAAVSILLLGSAYLLIYQTRRQRLARIGTARNQANHRRYRVIGEILGGIKTIKGFGSYGFFYDRYHASSRDFVRGDPAERLIQHGPRFLLELIAFGGIITLTLYLYLRGGEQLAQALPLLSLFAMAGYRLLPALQAIFGSIAELRSNRVLLDRLYPDLVASLPYARRGVGLPPPLPFRNSIRVSQLGFRFAEGAVPLFAGLDLEIRRGEVVAFVGNTGSGKTTLIDLLTGLLTPTAGTIRVDDTVITPENAAAWRRNVAYVQQDAFLFDATLADNLRLAPAADYDRAELDRVVEMAQLSHFVTTELPAGLDTLVGERGVRLSGGQRQRVGLARALLRRTAVLVLDEATSALDTVTERGVIDALRALPGDLTVFIVAHRLSTVRYADRIFVLAGGRVVATGPYDELLTTSEHFRRMVALS